MNGFIRISASGYYRAYSSCGRKLKDFSSYNEAVEHLNSNINYENIEVLKSLAKEARANDKIKLADSFIKKIADITGNVEENADLSYSAIMREIKDDKEKRKTFMVAFKKAFDAAVLNGIDNPDQIALFQAIKDTDYNKAEK